MLEGNSQMQRMKNNKTKPFTGIVHGPKHTSTRDMKKYLKDYATSTTAHGFSYLAEDGRSILERIFWIIVVVLALVFSYFQTSTLYKQWQDNPVITTLETVSLPIKEIEFPAVTICPQGSIKGIAETVLFHQLSRYITSQRQAGISRMKRSGNQVVDENMVNGSQKLSLEAMQVYVDHFLKDVYPGAKDKPTKLVHLLTSDQPRKMAANDAVMYQSMEEKCNPENDKKYLELLNKNLENDTCPEGFELLDNNVCVHYRDDLMTFGEANDYCQQQDGANILQLGTNEELAAFKGFDIPGMNICDLVLYQ